MKTVAELLTKIELVVDAQEDEKLYKDTIRRLTKKYKTSRWPTYMSEGDTHVYKLGQHLIISSTADGGQKLYKVPELEQLTLDLPE